MTLKHVFAMGESRLPGVVPHYSFAHNPIDNFLSLRPKRSADRSMPWGRLDDYSTSSWVIAKRLHPRPRWLPDSSSDWEVSDSSRKSGTYASSNVMIRIKPFRTATTMPVTIEGVEFFTTTEVTQMLGVSRQTLWRWRAEGNVPLGHRFRRKSIVFSKVEVDEIVAFGNKIEPIAVDDRALGLVRHAASLVAMK